MAIGLWNSTAALLQRMMWAARAGLTFGGSRDIYKVLGYAVTLKHENFVLKYVRQDIAHRVIHAPVDATWSDPPQLYTDPQSRETWKEWDDFIEETNAIHYLHKLDIFAGLGVCAVMVVGLDDGRPLDQPVNTSRQNRVIYLQPYLEASIEIDQYDEDQNSPRFGKPVMYCITPGDLNSSTQSSVMRTIQRNKFRVHYSRVLHVADNTLEDSVFGYSRLTPVYNTLDDIQKVCGGSAETYWLAANRGLHVNIDKEMDMDETDEKNLSDEVDEYQHQLRRIIRTRGVDINSLGSDVANPKEVFNVLLALLSAQTGIPQRVLMGSEAGSLASQQDRANWAIQVEQRERLFAGPVILKPFLDMLEACNVLKRPSEKLVVGWPDPFKLSPLERAQTSAQMARSAVNIAKAIQTSQELMIPLVSREEARMIIAPGTHIPVLMGSPTGTLPPDPKITNPKKFAVDSTQPTQL